MRARTVIISLAVHVAIAAVAFSVKGRARRRLATVISVVEPMTAKTPVEPPKPEPKADEPKDKKPARKKRTKPRTAKKVTSASKLAAKPQVARPSPSTSGRRPVFHTGLMLGNADGVGLAIDVEEGPISDVRESGPVGSTGPADGAGEVVEAPKRYRAPRCTEPIEPARPARKPKAIGYSTRAREAGAQGRLVLAVSVNAEGRVERVRVVSSVDPTIDEDATAAVRTWRFEPATQCGKPVAYEYRLARRFELVD